MIQDSWQELPDKMVAVRDNSDNMAYILMKRSQPGSASAKVVSFSIRDVFFHGAQHYASVNEEVFGPHLGMGVVLDSMILGPG